MKDKAAIVTGGYSTVGNNRNESARMGFLAGQLARPTSMAAPRPLR